MSPALSSRTLVSAKLVTSAGDVNSQEGPKCTGAWRGIMDIYTLVFREVDEEWEQLYQGRAEENQSHIESLKWSIENLKRRMEGFSEEENLELMQRVEEYEQEIRDLSEHEPEFAPLVFHILERKVDEDRDCRAWIRDESGLREIPIDAIQDPSRPPMPWLSFTILDEQRVQMNWMFAPLIGFGDICVVDGTGESAYLKHVQPLWIS